MGGRRQKPSPNRLENIMLVIYLVWEYNQYVSCPKCVLHYVAVQHFHKGDLKLKRKKVILFLLLTGIALLASCGKKSVKKEEAETIRVYLWTTNLYDKYAPYIQSQLPDVNIEFVVGNNDLDFYKFLDENGGLPDIITCCRFSLHDASLLKDSLMDLSTTNEAGAVYNTYLNNFMNEDGSVNWLPVCADAHGFVVNKDCLKSMVLSCQQIMTALFWHAKFEEAGVRGFTADYYYDYTCMETLQGLSASELTFTDGRKWRTAYSDPANKERVGLDDIVWPQAFEHMEQFINDVKLGQDDLDLTYDDVISMYQNEELAMYFGSSFMVKTFQDQGIDTAFLPIL
mgnify:CR=1 FL=1